MKLDIKSVKDRGTNSERLVIQVLEDCDIGDYISFVTKRIDDKISIVIENPFWFPDKKVEKGDLIVLYTKSGNTSFKVNKDESKTHFFYRNMDNPVFIEDKYALLLEAKNWQIESNS
ncbi:hypothetical protein OIU83_21305 [Flavobacterium sp. LS1R49]|uniref:Uncharacterized protein n=1 Tax=Flavobacterium shii TaxID=2987687 RepID=A0A9X2ZIV2_9FLAO|nr:hypothetical protein [Flavobacterium shii]MCV9930210.1 hypothetical protein [Flavobacterium shii]